MPSITTWARLEPQTGDADIAVGYAARVHDPLWFLARQWQLGEFHGQDAGTPIVARWRARVGQLDHFVAGPVPWETRLSAPRFDPTALPLQTLVERQPLRAPGGDTGLAGLRWAVESGQHFSRLLSLQAITSDPRPAFIAAYPMPALTDAQRAGADPETAAFADLVAGRALDGRRLRAALGDPASPHLDPALNIMAGDRAEVLDACRTWLAWWTTMFSEPEPGVQAWQPDQLEYDFTLSTRVADDVFGERPLSAERYADGALDWYSFDLNFNINTGTTGEPPGQLVARTVLPAPVTFHGMPAQRFWEVEDARIDLGALQPGATDLAQLLLVETLTGYGNDWFVIPVDLPVGSLTESTSLVITDTFGVQTLLRPNGDVNLRPSQSGSSMFTLSRPGEIGQFGPPADNLFFLPATVIPLEGPVLEEIMLVRDEVANLAWAIERRLENPLEIGVETIRDVVDTSSPPPPVGPPPPVPTPPPVGPPGPDPVPPPPPPDDTPVESPPTVPPPPSSLTSTSPAPLSPGLPASVPAPAGLVPAPAGLVPAPAGSVPVYRLATPVPPHWVPLLPVRPSPTTAEVRLARGAVLDLNGVPHVVEAVTQLLRAADPSARLLVREEEVPREGVVVRRVYQAARWHDGRLFVWAANRASVGRGEASSGLTFDALAADPSGG